MPQHKLTIFLTSCSVYEMSFDRLVKIKEETTKEMKFYVIAEEPSVKKTTKQLY